MKREKYEPVLKNISYFIKWVEGAIVIGIVSGCIGTAFGKCVLWVSAFFQSHPWMVFLLPLTGLLVLGVYHVLGESNNRGTNMVIESIYSNTEISFATAPAVFAGTLLTHLGGGSAGREGAALQMGGSIGTQIGKWLKFDEKDKKIAVMCGMSGVFAALFAHRWRRRSFRWRLSASALCTMQRWFHVSFLPLRRRRWRGSGD